MTGAGDFGPDFATTVDGYSDAIVRAALDADMFHYMKDHCLTAFPNALLSFVGDPDRGWMVWYIDPQGELTSGVAGAAHHVPLVGGLLSDVVKGAGAATGSMGYVRKFTSPYTGATPASDWLDMNGIGWDIQTDSTTPSDKLAKWEGRMRDLSATWGSVPDPAGLLKQSTRLTDGASSITTSTEDEKKFVDQDYEDAVHNLKSRFNLTGHAFEAFQSTYAEKGYVVTHDLRLHMLEIACATSGDAVLCQQVRSSVNALLGKTADAMAASTGGFGDLGIPGVTDIANGLIDPASRGKTIETLFFTVAGAVVGTVAAVASGGTAVAVLAGVAGTGLTALTSLKGLVADTQAAVPSLAADTPGGVWTNLTTQLDTLDSNYADAEGQLSSQAQETLDKLGGVLAKQTTTLHLPFGWDIPTTRTVITGQHDGLGTLQQNSVVMAPSAPDKYAATEIQGSEGDVANARDWLTTIAEHIYSASNKAYVDASGFSRAAGLGDDPSYMICGAAGELRLRLRNHASLMDEGALNLWKTWQDFEETDSGAAGNLNTLRGKLSQKEINELYGVGQSQVSSANGLRALEHDTKAK
ncbi:MAG: hypothetical protein FWE71_04300 [Nocardioidaceae bacterium]|nr:hypothetical protein [Nocardioidaceae bacterium]